MGRVQVARGRRLVVVVVVVVVAARRRRLVIGRMAGSGRGVRGRRRSNAAVGETAKERTEETLTGLLVNGRFAGMVCKGGRVEWGLEWGLAG